jgi:hypothetical protein
MTAITKTPSMVDTLSLVAEAFARGLAAARSAGRRHLAGAPARRREYYATARPALSDRMLLLAPPIAR